MVKENLSSKFILPLIGGKKIWKDFTSVVNCYIKDEVKGKEYNNHLFLLTNTKSMYFEKQKELFKSLHLYVDSYVYDSYEMFVFNIPEDCENILELFKEGKYSYFPNEYKNYIIKFYTNKSSKTPILKDEISMSEPSNFIPFQQYIESIVYRSEKMYNIYDKILDMDFPRELELCNKPNIQDEVFTESTLKELLNLNETEWI